MFRRVLRVVPIFVVLALAGIQAVRPERTNPAVEPSSSLAAHVPMTPEVNAILSRACRDCHSNETRWPWYSNVAPVSWFVIDHVNHGRGHFNFSEWSQYDADRRSKIVEGICREASEGKMPIGSYLLAHRDARLTAGDVRALCDWSRRVR